MIYDFKSLRLEAMHGTKRTLVVAAPEDEVVLKTIEIAVKKKMINAILIGDERKINFILKKNNIEISNMQIINEPNYIMAAYMAVSLIHDGVADMYMKGSLDTKTFLKSVLDKHVGIRTDQLLSHVAVFKVEGIKRFLFLTDVAFVTYPSLEDKVHLIENAVSVCRACGIENPRVAPLCAVEVVNPKMKETVEADLLHKMNQNGEIKNCIVDGPISMDIALNFEAAWVKHAEKRPAAGKADIMLFPDIHSGNLVYKTLVHTTKMENAGILVGTKVPAILTSRSDSIETKLNSIAMAKVLAGKNNLL